MVASSNTIPSPFPLTPTDQWDGIDGNWSTFRMSIGTYPQNFRVLISTRGSNPWVPLAENCQNQDSDCGNLRGVEQFNNRPSSGFRKNESSTWKNLGMYSLSLEEDLGYQGNGFFGDDTVRLGYDGDNGALVQNNSLVVGTFSDHYYMGLLGVSSTQTKVGSEDTVSFIDSLKNDRQIPSSSYGYTAGAKYQRKGVPASLVLGGYDESRLEPAKLAFDFANDADQPLKVGIQSIITSRSLAAQTEVNLIPVGKPAPWSYIDSTVPHLWLPKEVCDKFEAAFGLTYDESGVYLVNETIHDRLVQLNPTLTFQLGNDIRINTNNTSITLPYAAFDLWKRTATNSTTVRYFPLRRSPSEKENKIGRVFLQEAYLIVDHERRNFSLSQAKFADPMPPPDIRAIYSPGTVFPAKGRGLSLGAKAGIAIAAVLAFLLVVAAVLFRCWWNRRHGEKGRSRGASIATSTAPTYREKYDQQPPGYTPLAYDSNTSNSNHNRIKPGETWVEMPAGQVERRPELEGTQSLSYELADNHEPGPVHEMEANATSENNEANSKATDGGGKVSTEKTSNKKRGRRASMVPFSSHD
ncbi:Peptidase aspartic protein [Lasiodiplodia theobromae]|uniref:Peptidase aspartic protein n=1 Tax=Lasiodiplodia theobromae TaxID=45133 RepID=UPI0015C3DE98|nr:Peptidase aspartic protein [Lasiodiplodia theobromae]KAF4537191.1 Peptidase aspartic protein [Lasiodiplodia theobromae]